MSHLVPPHGGKLLPLLVHDSELEESIKEAETLPKVRLDSREVSDLDSWEMYDLKEDPRELNNIVNASPEAEELKSKLKPRVRRWAS